MAEKISKRQKFKRFLKRNLTPTWAKHFSYQVFSFLVSVLMVILVANYAFTKSYDERTLRFVDDFTITAHTGAFNTTENSLESVQAALDHNVDVIEIDIRQRLDGTVVMSHDIITATTGGIEIAKVFKLIKDEDVRLNLDIKETSALAALHDLIIEYDLINRVFLTGIETFMANDVVEFCPDVPFYINYIPSRIKIFSEDYQLKLIEMLDATGAIGINCPHSSASRTLSNVLHEKGYKLSVWTVDETRHIKRALINKPDNITTNYPDRVQEIIKNWKKKA